MLPFSKGNETCRLVLYSLQAIKLFARYAYQQRVAVVQAGRYQRLDNILGGVLGKIPSYG